MALVFNIPVFGFQSTLPRRERLGCGMRPVADFIFQSTLPRRERPCRHTFCVRRWKFQSTLPRRERLLKGTQIRAIFGNGNKACEFYGKYALPLLQEKCPGDWKDWKETCTIRRLPSTSPANAAWSLDRLIASWGEEIKGVLDTIASSY